MQESNPVLILGGTNFMGKDLVDRITKIMPTSQVWLINRGKIYWNNEVYLDNPHLKYFYGDRNQHKEMSKAVGYLNEKVGISTSRPWTAVIDFTSFKWRDIQSIAKPLVGKTEIYIFISTDSLYNNTPFDGIPIQESKYPLEQMYKKQKGTKVSDKYGYDKLKCELYLQRKKNLPYICLRLPDVLGPYDNTSRYWCTMEWIKHSHKYPVELNEKDKKMKLSFVYSKDLSQLITELLKNRQTVQKHRSYNFCFRQSVTYEELVRKIGSSFEKPIQPKFVSTNSQQSNGFYPSTYYTCVNPDLSIKELNWNPSLLDECIKESTQFFDKRGHKYPAQQKEMMKEFKKKVLKND